MKTVNTNFIDWAVVCVNEFAKSKKIPPGTAFQYLLTYGGLEFIEEHYEAEHLLSIEDTIDDINHICRQNGGKL